jgi:hypothetical protein
LPLILTGITIGVAALRKEPYLHAEFFKVPLPLVCRGPRQIHGHSARRTHFPKFVDERANFVKVRKDHGSFWLAADWIDLDEPAFAWHFTNSNSTNSSTIFNAGRAEIELCYSCFIC